MKLVLKLLFLTLFSFALYAEFFDAVFFFFSRNSTVHYPLGQDVVYLLKTLFILGSLFYSLKKVIFQKKKSENNHVSKRRSLFRRLIYEITILALLLTIFFEGKNLIRILCSEISIEEAIVDSIKFLFICFCLLLTMLSLKRVID